MREIPLTQGKVALVDDEDFEYISQFKWYAHRDCKTFYMVRMFRDGEGKRVRKKVHELFGFELPRGFVVDHIDGNGLNNQRSNLRVVTQRGNCQNLHISKSSRFPGVGYKKRQRNWEANIRIGGKRRYLGVFAKEEDAASIYKAFSDIIEYSKSIPVRGCCCE